MCPLFSERYGYGDDGQPYIIDDAPQRLRDAYVDIVLTPFVYIDRDDRYSPGKAVLGAKSLYETLTSEHLYVKDDGYTDSWLCLDRLGYFVSHEVKWNEFYDIVVSVGSQIKDMEGITLQTNVQPLTYKEYQLKVNNIFHKSKVVWRLDDNAELYPETPKELESAIAQTIESLTDKYTPSLNHLNKALKYIRERRSLDPENAIKEIISSIEALGSAIWPDVITLGDTIHRMRNAGWPSLLVSMIEKFYAFASNEPAVRHGKNVESRIQLADAQFCVYTGIALLQYITTYESIRT